MNAHTTTNRNARRHIAARKKALLLARCPDATPVAWHVCPVSDLPVPNASIDWIITDPPYERPAIDAGVYADLARSAARILRPGGGLVVLTGNAFLPQVFAQLGTEPSLEYRWILGYVMPGASGTFHTRQINGCNHKPVLVFHKRGGAKPRYIVDLLTVPYRRRQENGLHQWQQQEAGMALLVKHFAAPQESVCDPFAGAGTIPLVAKRHGCRVVASDIDSGCVETGKRRLENVRVGAGTMAMLF